MKIVYDYPPNYVDVAAAFNIKDRKNVIFTYGGILYVPGGKAVGIDKPLMKHEEVHARQQKKMGIEKWWSNFLTNPKFRLSQELEAYREQYRAMASLPPPVRIGYLDHIANDLGGEIYGNMLTPDEARAVITEGIILKHIKPAARKSKKLKRQNRKKGRK